MAKYKIAFKKSVAKDLRKIPNTDVQRILGRIDELAEDPRSEGCARLSAQERYRARGGSYRIIYEIQDLKLLVLVVKVGHRSGVHRSE